METIINPTPRRTFLNRLAFGIAFLGAGKILYSNKPSAESPVFAGETLHPKEEWFKQIKGKHRMVFDVPQPHHIYPFAWPRVFLMTNEQTGTPISDSSVVVVLRHSAIGYAMDSSLWKKYNLGEVFEADDPLTKKPSTRNPFWKPGAEDFKVPGVGAVQIGINDLQSMGVMFCVCEMAIKVYSSIVAEKTGGNGEEIRKEWIAGLLPGIHSVPSGLWALTRAQEHGCSYCFAG